MGNVKTTKGTIFFKVVVMPISMPPDVCHGYISSQLAVQPFTTLVHPAPSTSFIDFLYWCFQADLPLRWMAIESIFQGVTTTESDV